MNNSRVCHVKFICYVNVFLFVYVKGVVVVVCLFVVVCNAEFLRLQNKLFTRNYWVCIATVGGFTA